MDRSWTSTGNCAAWAVPVGRTMIAEIAVTVAQRRRLLCFMGTFTRSCLLAAVFDHGRVTYVEPLIAEQVKSWGKAGSPRTGG
ncbi:hypothetical protein GCM10020216_015760 [Nonomuraea helvata]